MNKFYIEEPYQNEPNRPKPTDLARQIYNRDRIDAGMMSQKEVMIYLAWAYLDLEQKYNELKWRMDGLEK